MVVPPVPADVYVKLFPEFANQFADVVAVYSRFTNDVRLGAESPYGKTEMLRHEGPYAKLKVTITHCAPLSDGDWTNRPFLLHHKRPIQAPVLYRLQQVLLPDAVARGEVGDGAGDFEDLVIGAGGEV